MNGVRWRGDELFARPDWEVELTEAELQELEAAVDATRRVPRDELDPRVLSMPRLAATLANVRDSLEHGGGAARIRGLPVGAGERGLDRLARSFHAIACHVGRPVTQSAAGELLLHVRDAGYADGDPRVRGPFTNKKLRFHTDRCDVIAFLCVVPAQAGGDNDVIHSMVLYDELARRHPRALQVLREPFVYLRHTVDSGNAHRYTQFPVFSFRDGHFAASLLRVLIDRADKAPGVPSLTDEQRAALDTLEAVAEDPALYARFRLEAGDVLLLNNWVTLHRRSAFVDATDAARRRHLMRLWLSVPNSRPIDERFREHFGATEAGALRGGMRPRDGSTR